MHTCHAYACDKRVPQAMFMCKPHWMQLPPMMRKAIWDHYHPGQEDGDGITDEYAEAAKKAVRWMAAKEGHQIPEDAPELLVYDLTQRRADAQG